MRRIAVSDDAGNTVEFIRDLEFEIIPEFVGETATMASGRVVRDHVGIKNKLRIPTGWLSPYDLAKLCRMIGAGNVLTVRYPDVDGDHAEKFWVDPPVRRAFAYDEDGVRQWYGVEVTAEQYGVTPVFDGGEAVPGVLTAEIVDGALVLTTSASASISGGALTIAG